MQALLFPATERGVNTHLLPSVLSVTEDYALIPLGEKTPVLSRVSPQSHQSEAQGEVLVLPNEIIVGFAPQVKLKQAKQILQQQHLELLYPLSEIANLYLVRSQTAKGTDILAVTNQLYQVSGIQSAAVLNSKQSTKPPTDSTVLSPLQQTILPIAILITGQPSSLLAVGNRFRLPIKL